MDEQTSWRIQLCMAWMGPTMIIGSLLSWMVLGHNFSPPGSAPSGEELVDQYYGGAYQQQILLGMILAAIFGVFYALWSIQMSVQMWRREPAPILSLIQLVGGVLTAWVLCSCPALWAWCARYAGSPGIEPEMIKAVHVISWYLFDLTYMITTIQHIACGAFAILDRHKPAIFPTWAGWYSILVGSGFVLLSLVPYFDHGPFAMNGLVDLFVLLAGWAGWIVIYSIYMIRDLRRDPAANVSPAPAGSG